MNILLINLDSELAEENGSFSNGAYLRHIEYAKLLSHYFIIARTPRSNKFRIRNPVENLYIFPSQSLNKISFIRDAFRIGCKVCKENKIDLILCQDPFTTGLAGYLLKRRFGIPLNIHILSDIINNPYFLIERKLNYLLNKWAIWIIKKADAIRVTTTEEKMKLAKLSIDNKKIWSLPVFIDFNPYLQGDGCKIRKQYLSHQFEKLILFVGRIVKQKDLPTLIRAIPFVIREYPKSIFLIIGTGLEERKVKRLALQLRVSGNARFIGKLSYQDLPNYFSACDLFVMSSLYEGFPAVILGAMAAKRPIISTPHTGALKAIVDGKTGFIINFADSKQLAQRIIYLLKNPEIARNMGENGQKFVLENFAKDRILKDYLKMFDQTVSSFKDGSINYNTKD